MGWYGQSLDPAHQVDYGAGSRGLSGWWCVAAVGLGAGREGGTGKEGASNPCSLSLKLSLLSFNHEAFLATSPASECSIASVVIGPSTLQGNHDNGNKITTQIHATPCFCCTTFRRRIATTHTVHTRQGRAGQRRHGGTLSCYTLTQKMINHFSQGGIDLCTMEPTCAGHLSPQALAQATRGSVRFQGNAHIHAGRHM